MCVYIYKHEVWGTSELCVCVCVCTYIYMSEAWGTYELRCVHVYIRHVRAEVCACSLGVVHACSVQNLMPCLDKSLE